MDSRAFLAVCLNPTLQKTLRFGKIVRDKVNRTADHRLDASGKGVNVARVLTQLGKTATHLTHLGGDFAQTFLDLCGRDGLAVRWVDSGSQIRFCYTAIDAEDRSVTELVEESGAVAQGTEERLLGLFEEIVGAFGTLIVSGTKAAGYSDGVVPAMTRIAKAKGLRVILDVRGADLIGSLPFGPDVVKPNLHEFLATYLSEAANAAAEEEPDLRDAVVAAADRISAEYGSSVVLTRGNRPVWIYEGSSFREVSVDAVLPVNTTGSGDAFTAGLASILAEGGSLSEAVREGARCGALNAGLLKPGTVL